MIYSEINKPFLLPTFRLNEKERSKIEHEINTNYNKYNGQEFCVHYSYGLNNRSYRYYFENHGFNNYNIYERKSNDANERRIKWSN